MVNGEISLSISSEYDIVNARQRGKWFAEQIGFRGSELTILSTLISELARKVFLPGNKGRVVIQSVQRGNRKGIAINVSENPYNTYRVRDHESDFAQREKLSDERLRMLAGKNVADEFEVKPNDQSGSVVKVLKWL